MATVRFEFYEVRGIVTRRDPPLYGECIQSTEVNASNVPLAAGAQIVVGTAPEAMVLRVINLGTKGVLVKRGKTANLASQAAAATAGTTYVAPGGDVGPLFVAVGDLINVVEVV